MPEQEKVTDEAVEPVVEEKSKPKTFFDDKNMPGWNVGDRFSSKGIVFEITKIGIKGISAEPI